MQIQNKSMKLKSLIMAKLNKDIGYKLVHQT